MIFALSDLPNVKFVAFYSRPELYRVSGKFELLDRILPKFKKHGHR